MYQRATVVRNEQVIPGYMRMEVRAAEMAAAAQPGQFMMLRAWEGHVPFLPRPISINYADPAAGTLTFLYKVTGEGTERMAALRAGDGIQALGPLGHGFPLPDAQGALALIGRGIGIAPLRLLAGWGLARGHQVYAYLSAQSAQMLFDSQELTAMGAIVRSSADDRHRVTDLFAQDLKDHIFAAAYSCGSQRLMREMHALGRQYGFPTYVSLEEHMACGVGACKGCVCETHDRQGRRQYETVCHCGPVFPTERIV